MPDTGWIKLHRRIQENFLWEEKPFDRKSAWIDLLLLVNHRQKKIIFNGKPMTVKVGQHITSIGILAERWGWSKNKVYRFINTLESEHMIKRSSNKFRTVLTVENYGIYQGKWNSNESCDESSNESSNESCDESQTRMIKNDKEEKNEKKEAQNIFDSQSDEKTKAELEAEGWIVD